MLYNVRNNKFFWYKDGDFVEFKDIEESSLKNYTIYVLDGTVTDNKIVPIAFNNNAKEQSGLSQNKAVWPTAALSWNHRRRSSVLKCHA